MRFLVYVIGLVFALGLSAASVFAIETTVTSESHGTSQKATTPELPPKLPPALDALFGGPFELQDHKGQTRRDSDWEGQFKLIFFGYANCPIICPTTLQDVSAALDILGDDAKEIQPLFITIDPERDTAEVLDNYLSSFHSSIIGLTGSEAQISSVAKSYRVQRHKILLSETDHAAQPNHKAGHNGAHSGDELNYEASHSTLTYLMDRNGKFLTLFPYDTSSEIIAKRLRGYLNRPS